jgi:hypothetical protein
MSSVDSPAPFQLRVSDEDMDSDGFASLWNIAAATGNGELAETRAIASSLLRFLCHKKCDFVVVSTTNAEYLDQWFERETSLIYDWKPESEKVDVMTQHAEVPFAALVTFLENNRYSPTSKHSPKRADRVEWFTNQWSVG